MSEESIWRRALAIFRELVEVDAAARQDGITTLTKEDSDLRERVEALLAADRLRDARLDGGADRFFSRIRESPEEALWGWLGRQVGPYRIVRLLGWGGMGAVFLGERCDGQFEQRVAIKVARTGLTGHGAIERFLAERRILAGLEHPRIARLLDGGVSAEGLPYFAMEYVEGVPITDYCDAERLDVEGRLGLFLGICEAVDHAHRHLVVHRDIKPSNLLVSREGEVKLLDFGIAKLLDPGLDGSATIDRLLTPAYAAPEQLRGEPVTVAADVYSLGVVLFELLTGQRPFGGGDVARAAPRAELDREPERASSVALARESDDSVARRRRRRALRGDIDTILATTLHADPERRYPSARALAEDLHRHLERRPIVARRARLAYRAGKFAARHRWSVAIAASLTLALVAALAMAAAQAQAKVREAAASQQVTSFLIQLFQAPDPTVAKGAELSARELLDQGAERLRSTRIVEPRLRSRLLHTVAATYAALGAYDRALGLAAQALALRRGALPENSVEVAESLDQVGEIRRMTADYDGSEPLLREALATRRELLAPDDPGLIESLGHLGRLLEDRGAFAKAEPLLREALASSERRFGGEAVETAARLDDLATLEADLGRESSAVELLERALAIREGRLGSESLDVATSLARLGERLDEAGDYRQAESQLTRALAIRRRVLGLEHPLVASTELGLAGVYMDRDRLDEAEKTAESALGTLRRALGASHPKVGEAINLLGIVRTERRDYAGAEPLFEELLASYKKRFGERHPDTLSIENNLAITLLHLGRVAAAERLQRDVLAKLPADNGQATGALTLQNLATSLELEGRSREAVTFARQALELQRRREGETSGNVAIAVRSLAIAEELAGDQGAAERDFRAGLQMGEELAPTHGNATYEWRIPLADFLVGAHRCAEARALLRSSAEELARRGSASEPVWMLEERLLAAACEARRPASRSELVATRAALHALPSVDVDLFPTARALLAGR